MLQFPYPIPQKLVSSHLEKILFLAKVLENVPVPKSLAPTIFHRQVLKSSVYSARIEGNTISFSEVENEGFKVQGQGSRDSNSSEEKQKKEVENCIKVLRRISTLPPTLTIDLIKELHGSIMNGLHAQAGNFRGEQSAIFDSFGNVVYLTPDRTTMEQMLEVFLFEANKQRGVNEELTDVARLHYYFEKIHPFFDGNGRTGRVLLQWQLHRTKLFGDYILPIDEYFELHRSAYYAYLEGNSRHAEEFSSFVLEGIAWSLDAILSDLKTVGEKEPKSITPPISQGQSSLLPRREEILAIITDHPICSFDFITRRFPGVPDRTIAYDVQWLVKHGYVIKHGSTRGVRYSAKENSSA